MKAGMCWHICCVRINCPVSISAREASGFREQSSCPAHELWVLAAGPLANFIMAALLLQLHRQASYALYFLAAVSLCTGVYNLMPFGVLDGARLLQNLLPAESRMRCAVPSGCCCACSARRRSALRCWAGCRAALVRRLSWGRVICWQRSSGKIKKKGLRSVNGTVHRPFLFAFCAQIRYNDPKTAACAAGRVRGTRPVLAHRALRTLNHANRSRCGFVEAASRRHGIICPLSECGPRAGREFGGIDVMFFK
ncbi:MAG: M50 family metallopeptidase [Ruthenibacterium lactatiformans]